MKINILSNMNKKVLYTTIALVAVLGVLTTAYAFTVSSPQVTVVVSALGLTISTPPNGAVGETFLFSGTLTGPATRSNVLVTLSVSLNGGAETSAGTDTTDANGDYSISWIPTEAGTYTIKAIATAA